MTVSRNMTGAGAQRGKGKKQQRASQERKKQNAIYLAGVWTSSDSI